MKSERYSGDFGFKFTNHSKSEQIIFLNMGSPRKDCLWNESILSFRSNRFCMQTYFIKYKRMQETVHNVVYKKRVQMKLKIYVVWMPRLFGTLCTVSCMRLLAFRSSNVSRFYLLRRNADKGKFQLQPTKLKTCFIESSNTDKKQKKIIITTILWEKLAASKNKLIRDYSATKHHDKATKTLVALWQ